MLKTDIGRLRIASILDGVSYVILLFIAMPLKYLAEMPMAVRITGSAHGFLFVLLVLALLIAWVSRRLPFLWCVITFICAIIPFAPFFLDRKLSQFESKTEPQS